MIWNAAGQIKRNNQLLFMTKKESVSYHLLRQKPGEISESQIFWTQEHS